MTHGTYVRPRDDDRRYAWDRSKRTRDTRVQLTLTQRLMDARTTDNELRPQSWTERAKAGMLPLKDMTE